MRSSCLSCLLLLAACAGPGAPAGVSNVGPGVGPAVYAPAPHYAGLFEDGRSWTYQVETSTSFYDPSDSRADADGNVKDVQAGTATCRVIETGVLPNGRISRIECQGLDGSMGMDPITGVWATDPRGLWKVERAVEPGEIPAMPDDEMTLSSAPAPSRKETFDPEFGPDPVGAVEVTQEGDAWCRQWLAVMGDEAWTKLCFTGEGIVGGEFGWAGGSVNETTFTLVR